mmetsp:Transcript_6425/g.26029  ORF Transcript_6425/g.26029 Transcript_6425/m.26029 type:complete len:223 (+) Transcript_6425:1738-2406(+)
MVHALRAERLQLHARHEPAPVAANLLVSAHRAEDDLCEALLPERPVRDAADHPAVLEQAKRAMARVEQQPHDVLARHVGQLAREEHLEGHQALEVDERAARARARVHAEGEHAVALLGGQLALASSDAAERGRLAQRRCRGRGRAPRQRGGRGRGVRWGARCDRIHAAASGRPVRAPSWTARAASSDRGRVVGGAPSSALGRRGSARRRRGRQRRSPARRAP